MLSSLGLRGQIDCGNYSVVPSNPGICDDNGTPTVLTDDTYTVDVTILSPGNPFAPFGAEWSSDSPVNPSGKFIDGPVFTFGPFLVADGDQVVTVTDPLGPCSETITLKAPNSFCSTLPPDCPEVNVSASYLSDEGCCVTYMVIVDGVDPTATSFGMDVSFNVSGGTIDKFEWLNEDNPLKENASIEADKTSTVASLFGVEIPVSFDPNYGGTEQLLLTICGEPNECMTLSRSQGGQVFSSGQLCSLAGASPTQEFCFEGNDIDGFVYNLNAASSSCPNGTAIENAIVSISNDIDGELCSTATDVDGLYTCVVCEDGPYTVCVETTCKEPCGLDQADIALLTNCILQFADCPEGTQVAADINGDGQVTGADVVALREMLLNGASVQEPENWCRFVPVPEWQFIQAGFLTPDEVDNCYEIQDANESVDFIQFNLGDLNGSCNDCTHENNDGRIIGGQSTLYALWSDGVYRLYTEDLSSIRLYSLQVELPVGSQVAIVKGLSDDLAYSVEGNLLSVIWNTEDLSVVDVNPHSPLLEIVLDGAAIVSPTLVSDSDNVYIFSEDTYYSDVDYSNSLQVKDRQEGSDFMVVINDNHFASFPMVYGETAEVTLYDLSGNRYYSQRHSILDMTMISVDHLQLVEGVYLLTLSTGSYVTTEKVFITQ